MPQIAKTSKKYPFRKRKGLLFLVAYLLRDALAKKSFAVWQRRSEIRRKV